MAFIPILVLVCVTIWALFHVKSKRSLNKYPPGPYPLPIIGNILLLGSSPHISIANLAKKYGSLMYLKLGTLNTIVVSSPEMAKLVLQKHDQVFSGRTVPLGGQVHNYHKYSMGLLPAEDQWRNLRKVCSEHMFSASPLDATQGIRQEKLNELGDYVRKCCDEGKVINIGEAAFTTTLSLMSATLFSYDFGGFDSESAQQLRERVRVMTEVLGTPNLADFFPFLKVFDPQGITRRSKIAYGKLIESLEEIIVQRLASRSRSNVSTAKRDFLDELLHHFQESESEYNINQIKFIFVDLMGAGTGPAASTVECTMTELLRNSEKMSKVKSEIDSVIGGRDQVLESDISRLPYLQAVVKETLRQHPPAPFLLPHKAEADIEVHGYTIPKNAQVLVNVWAISKDSNVWSNPNSFEPERFLGSEINYNGGQNFELIPFGSGRRMCPGIPLAQRMVHLILASLIHKFDWKLKGGMTPDEVDLSESFGLVLEKTVSLEAVPFRT